MTEAQAIEQLKALEGMGDTEAEHGRADDILCDFLQANGYAALAAQFREQSRTFWYA
jgi:hypothetical protein